MLKVLGKATSINVRKVLWLCSELDLEFEHEEWATPDRSTSDPAFLRLNPNGPDAHVAGAHFTLADIVVGLSVNRWLITPFDKPALPALDQYLRRLESRPSYRRHGANGTP